MQLAFTTVDELFALLEQAGEALDYREVWPHLFPVAGCSPALVRTLVDDIVRTDERFVWESDVHLGLTAWRAAHRDLSDVVFTVVDLETTGGTPGLAKITEVGAVRVEGGTQTATFSSLVDPRVHIPAMITRLTGIDDGTVAGAPPIETVLPRFVEFTEGTVLVAHNARFDLGFLDYELGRLCRQSFQRPVLDTLRLARKLCPQQRCSLAALAERFDTAVKPGHRALRDAQATAELLLLFLSWLEEQGVTTLEEVARYCEPGARRNYHKIALTEGLPTRPGVYVMRDKAGHALYIGKAENLRRRTRDHFLQRQAYGARQALELLERIDVVETGSEFGALLLEQRLIARHRPLYNQHGTRVPAYHYAKLTSEAYPRLYATPNLRDDGGLYAGPFRKASLARAFVDCLTSAYPLRTCVRVPAAARPAMVVGPGDRAGEGAEDGVGAGAGDGVEGGAGEGAGGGAGLARSEDASGARSASGRARTGRRGRQGDHPCPRAGTGACLAPCRRELNGEYDEAVSQVRRVLRGDGAALDARLVARQAHLVELLAFEQAQRVQSQRELAERALRSIRRLTAAVREEAVLVYPARSRGRARLWGVRGGAVVVEREVRVTGFDHTAALDFLAELAAAAPPAPPLPSERIDEILLVHGWLQRHRAAVGVLDLGRGDARTAWRALDGAARPALASALVDRVRRAVAPADEAAACGADLAGGTDGGSAAP
ncbi:MAG: exonuclease domain-containing protein, partial [Thermoleophilia bacterium]|nr:exonuclease domain-containing protein [Thermoleophilia bacterium]